jgi:Sigma-70, region 4/WD40-like Beta Propeller Repeat
VVQEALARAWERAEKGEEIESLPIWVTGAALKLSRGRARFRRGKTAARASSVGEDSDLETALAALSRRQREAVILRHYLGLDVGAIADSLGVMRRRARSSLDLAMRRIDVLKKRKASDGTAFEPSGLLRQHFERVAHPGVTQPSMFQAIDRRRANRSKTRRLRSAGAVLAVLAAAVGIFAMLGNADRKISPAPPSPTLPDTSAIVAVSYDGGGSSLWAGPRQLTPTASHDLQPAVDPAGLSVAFVRTSPSYGVIRSGLYTVPFAGVPAGPCPTCGFKSTRLLGPYWFGSDPAWSPDGTKIAFAGGAPSKAAGIYVVSAMGGAPHLIYASSNGSAMQPSWSPDGSQIVFAEATGPMIGSTNFDLYVVEVTLGSYRPAPIDITPGNSRSEIAPAWSPDGKVIAFSLQTTTAKGLDGIITTGVIAMVSPDGSHLRVLTPPRAPDDFDLDSDPAWSPDGRFLAFDRSGRNSGVYYVASAGGLPTFVRPGSDPSWRPTGATGLPTEPPVGGLRIPGLSFPACDVSSIHGRFLWHQSGEIAYLLVQAGAVPCTAGAPAHQFIALTVHGHGPFPSTVLSGPISDCQPACRVFAAPFLDNGPVAELAVMLTQRGGAVLIELFKADTDGVFNSVLERSGAPYLFNWGMRGIYRAGVSCSPPDSPQTLRQLDFWTAVNRSGAWHLNETFATLRGTTMIVTRRRESVLSSAAALPAGGGNDFCGAPVRP